MAPRVVVVGAGLQGLCVAVALAERGIGVTVLEGRPGPMREASFCNEGKIHLGFVYALDESLETGRRMLEGALTFASLLDRWCGPLPWHDWKTEGFRYALMPGSLVDMPFLADYYERLRGQIAAASEGVSARPEYLGKPLTWFWRPPSRSDLDPGTSRGGGSGPAQIAHVEGAASLGPDRLLGRRARGLRLRHRFDRDGAGRPGLASGPEGQDGEQGKDTTGHCLLDRRGGLSAIAQNVVDHLDVGERRYAGDRDVDEAVGEAPSGGFVVDIDPVLGVDVGGKRTDGGEELRADKAADVGTGRVLHRVAAVDGRSGIVMVALPAEGTVK